MSTYFLVVGGTMVPMTNVTPTKGAALYWDGFQWNVQQGGPGGSTPWADAGILSVATRTALSATADASLPDGQPAFNEESLYRANWQLDRTSTLTADGVTVLATQSGTGRWILSSCIAGTVPVTEVGADPTGSVDSLAAVNAAASALDGSGVAAFVPGGTYNFSAAPTLTNVGALVGVGVSFTGAGASGAQSALQAAQSRLLSTSGARVEFWRAKADAIQLADGAVTASSAAFSSAGASFVAGDVGKLIVIKGAGAAGVPLVTTISAVTDGQHVTLAAAATTTVSGATWAYGTDNTTAFTSAFASLTSTASLGAPLLLGTGSYLTQPVQTPSGVTIVGTVGTKIILASAGSGIQDCIFWNEMTTSGGTLAVNASNTPGSDQVALTTDTGLSVGTMFVLQTSNGLFGAIYTVTAITGTGPYTVTVDRPILGQFDNTCTAQVVTFRPTDVRIYGHGMTVTGCGGNLINFNQGLRVIIDDVTFDGGWGSALVGGCVFDTKSYGAVLSNSRFVGTDCDFANCEGFLACNVTIDGQSIAQGFIVEDSFDGEINNVSVTGCGEGLSFQGATTQGSFLIRVAGGNFSGNSDSGIQLQYGSSRITIDGARGAGNSNNGVHVNNATYAATRIQIANCNFGGNTCGIRTETGCKAIEVSNTDLSNCSTNGIVANDDLVATGITYRGTLAFGDAIIDVSGGVAMLRNLQLECTTDGAYGIIVRTGTRTYIDGIRLTMDNSTGTTYGIDLIGTAIVTLSNARFDGSSVSFIGIQSASGTTLRLGQAVDLTGATAGFRLNCAGYVNQSFVSGAENQAPLPLVANGTTAVSVAFPDLRDTDEVVITYNGTGTWVGGGKIVKTPGTGFSYTGASASDTANYDWRIIG